MALNQLAPVMLWSKCQIMKEAKKFHVCHGSLELTTISYAPKVSKYSGDCGFWKVVSVNSLHSSF